MVMHISRALSSGGRALGTMLSVPVLAVPLLWVLLLVAGPDQGWAFDDEFDVCSTSGESIPDGPNGVLEDIIAVAAESTVADITVTVDITHTFIGDLEVDLVSPAGTVVRLHDREGGTADDIRATFSDFGATDLDFDCECLLAPSGPGELADFNDEAADGDWTLSIVDNVRFGTGSLQETCLNGILAEEEAQVDLDRLAICTTPEIEIPDGPGSEISATLEVYDGHRIRDLGVSVEVRHTFIGDLTIDIESPAATVVRVHDRNGGFRDDLDVTFVDTGAYNDGLLNCACQKRPYGVASLSDFDEESTLGDWVLTIGDHSLFDDGYLNGFCLQVKEDPHDEIHSLSGEPVPAVIERISDLPLSPNFIVDEEVAVQLGKAFFWDVQAGSDGQACASCHFHAGADVRVKNQISPGLRGGNAGFDATGSGGIGGPNYTLNADDFPFHRLVDPADRDSMVEFDTDDVTSSQGVFGSTFNDIILGEAGEECEIAGDGAGDPLGFHVEGINTRRVEPRNTPTVVNAAFNFRNFWDGRANNIFNGVDVFGRRNEDATILVVDSRNKIDRVAVEFTNSSLASQAAGPPTSPFEMSCEGRTIPKIGKKLLALTPLGGQLVDPTDSALGALSLSPDLGIDASYRDLIEDAFNSDLWDSEALFDIDQNEVGKGMPRSTDEYTMMESNFPLFWGLAIQAYLSTLISDNTPFDQYADGDRYALSSEERAGLGVFLGPGKCVSCHATAMFSKASTLHLIAEDEEEGLVERMSMGGEMFDYSLRGEGSVSQSSSSRDRSRDRGTRETWLLDVRVEGQPKSSSDGPRPGTAHGTIVLEKLNDRDGYGPESFAVYSFLLDPDGDDDTRDAEVMGVSSGGISITLHVIDDGERDIVTVTRSGEQILRDAALKGDIRLREPALYDNGFYNIGVRPSSEDLGVGAEDPFGNPLSFTEQYVEYLLGEDPRDPFQIDPCKFEIPWDLTLDQTFFPGGFGPPIDCDGEESSFITAEPENNRENADAIANIRVAVDGAFKVSTLRNIELTGPYFHNGGQATLEQVVQFYNRGSDFARENYSDLAPDIQPLHLSQAQQDALVAFLKALTDERVRWEEAPFDHPSIPVTNGHVGDEVSVTDADDDDQADDEILEIPAVGAGGRAEQGLEELKAFLED